jgi:predicted nucleic acid-binding protein
MFLLDTNVVSESRKIEMGRADPLVEAWSRRTGSEEAFLSVITLMELEVGVTRMERRDGPQGRVLRRWLDDQVVPTFQDRIVEIDAAIARRCAPLHVPDRRPERDAWIAATALVRGLIVVTRNTADFTGTGVALLNPWLPTT